MNEVTQDCQIDFLIRYFDEDDQQVKVRYFDSRFLFFFFIRFLKKFYTKRNPKFSYKNNTTYTN